MCWTKWGEPLTYWTEGFPQVSSLRGFHCVITKTKKEYQFTLFRKAHRLIPVGFFIALHWLFTWVRFLRRVQTKFNSQ